MSVDEEMLRPPQSKINPENTPYPSKYINLVDGTKMVVRQISRDEVMEIIPLFYDIVKINKDYYDLVGARILGELLAYVQYRVRDEYVLIGQNGETGEVLGLVNGHLTDNPKTGISYHTMTFKRGLRVGAHLFVAKMHNHFLLGNEEVLVVAESPIGFKRWMNELRLTPDKLGRVHELGGGPTYVLTKENWETYVEPERLFGESPVPDDLLENCKTIKLPDDVTFQITGVKKGA
ncbi:MAG: hypothetical protein ACXADW_00375 [Candidatus Hodarchaeales archaeon]|jgi:hypothetical protein